jgi:hypothetical protein
MTCYLPPRGVGGAMLRKFVVAGVVAGMLVALASPSKAADLPIKVPVKMSLATGAGGGGAVTFVAVGFIGVVAAICAYDLYLKIEGVKNWDGTPKTAPAHKHPHHLV